MLEDILSGLEPITDNILVIGIEKYGIDVINSLIDKEYDKIDYLALSQDNNTLVKAKCKNKYYTINDEFYSLINTKKAIYLVGEINNEIAYENTINLAKAINNHNIFNLMFITGLLIDDRLKDVLAINNILAFYDYGFDQIVDVIRNIVGLIIYPGYIGLDLYDIMAILKNKKKGYCHVISGNDLLECATNIAHEISNISNKIKGMVISLEANYNTFSLKEYELMLNKLKEIIPNYKDLDIVYGTQELNSDEFSYEICVVSVE